MKKAKSKPILKPVSKMDAATRARLSRRSRRRVIRTVVGAVLGGVIAGPLGAVVGTAVGVTSRSVPGKRAAAAEPKKTAGKKPGTPAPSPKAHSKRPVRKKVQPSINTYPNLP